MTKLQTIYKQTKTGATQQWEIIVDGNTFYTIEGQVDGKLTTSKPTICKGKNIGRSNETTPEQQALNEASAKRDKKLEKGYTTNITKISDGPEFFEPMLAQPYDKYKDKIEFPVLVQPKLDGCRCIIRKDGAWSRNGKRWVTIPHILKELNVLFNMYPNMILDGELYNMELHDDFNKITSLVKKQKPTAEDLQECEKLVQFHCYDIPVIADMHQSALYLTRQNRFWSEPLTKQFKYIKEVGYIQAGTQEEVAGLHEEYVGQGYEGAIIRLNAPYENKRSKNLLKLKFFFDNEYEIIDIREGKGNKTGMAAHADFITDKGVKFTANIKGTHEWLKELLENKEAVIGTLGTVRFPNLTPETGDKNVAGGVPRFGYLYSIRDYE